ncbi:MAG: NADPH-dependent F420 reductase [Gammaproteobacteria bacterium]|nr:NADPH-dependent F420 reductase [Gammaproteobacteria bacterium]|tara:strand:- start:1383 stop:2078 length:696 start_codon:yes stop_codon:yes gene_type:complete
MKRFFKTLSALLLSFSFGLSINIAMADTISIIGTGNVGAALGVEFAAQGHEIIYGSREPGRDDVQELVARTAGAASVMLPAQSVEGADIVVLAVPGAIAMDVVRGLGDLSGKILIDPTNRVAPGEDGYFNHTAEESSNGEMIQALVPDTQVVKAFNVLPAATMIEPGGPVTIPLVGNDEGAKAKVAELVTGMGLEPLDVGPIRAAHVLEGMLTIWLNARQAGTPYEYHFRR